MVSKEQDTADETPPTATGGKLVATVLTVAALVGFGLVVDAASRGRVLRAVGVGVVAGVDALPGSAEVRRETARWNGDPQEMLTARIGLSPVAVVDRYESLFVGGALGDEARPLTAVEDQPLLVRRSSAGQAMLAFMDKSGRRVAVLAFGVAGGTAESRYHVIRTRSRPSPVSKVSRQEPLPGGILVPSSGEILFRLDREGGLGMVMLEAPSAQIGELRRDLRQELEGQGFSLNVLPEGLAFEGNGISGLVTVEDDLEAPRSVVTLVARQAGQ